MTTHKILKYLIAVAVCLLATGRGVCKESGVVTLNVADGLVGESVYDVMTDHGGRIWIAAANGVNMYDGKQMTAYNLADGEHRMVTVNALCETRDKSIYAATNIGLFRLTIGNDRFERILTEVLQPECLLAVGDSIFIGGRQGLQIFDGERVTTTHLGQSRSGIDNIVRHYVRDVRGRIWFLGRYDLFLYDTKSGGVTPQGINSLLPERATPSQFEIVGDLCFIGTKADGFYIINLNTKEAKRITEIGHIVTSVRRSGDGYVCVGTNGSGAFLIDGNTGVVVARFSIETENSQLPTDAVNCYYRDASGVDWFGLVRYGLTYAYHRDPLFKPFRAGDFTTEGLNMRSYYLRGDEGVIGTHNGFYFIKGGNVRYYSPDMMGGGHIVNNIVYYRDEYYIGTFDGGISVLNPQTGDLRRLAFAPSLHKSTIGDLKIGPDSLLWVGTNDGLFAIDNRQIHHWFTEQNSHIQGGIILDITFDYCGNSWLTGADGISIYSGQTKEIIADPNYPEGFFNRQPYCRGSIGHDSIIFMRNGPQVFYTDAKMQHYGTLALPVNLPDIWCRDFVDDISGYYWISSAMGLFRLDYDGTGLMRLGSDAGLMGSINKISYDGQRLWVATSEGLFYISPKDIEAWSTSSNHGMHLYNIRRGSEMLSDGQQLAVNESQRITLGWNFVSDVVQLEAVLLDYAEQVGRIYEYSLDDEPWQIVLPNDQIALQHLTLGNHCLKIRLAGIVGTEAAYQVVVHPSTGAIVELLVFIILALLLWRAYRYRKNTKLLLTERDEIEDALIAVEQELEEAMDEEGKDDGVKSEKYQKVKIDEKECAEIVGQMRAYIEKGKIYTNTDIRMKDLADELHLSPSKLSQVFNLYLKENYYDFINRYRLEEFKRLIKAGEHKRVTITALSEQCGFKKSNFFSTFRKVEGMTPAEYLKKMR